MNCSRIEIKEKAMAKSAILLHQKELESAGIEIKPIPKGLKSKGEVPLIPHRDDYYMLIIQQKGLYILEIDFNAVTLRKSSLCFIALGQVHKFVRQRNSEGWLVFIDAKFIAKQYREIFDTFLHNRQAVSLQEEDLIFTMTAALDKLLFDEAFPLKDTLLNSLIDTVVGLVASKITQASNFVYSIGSQKYTIVTKFKSLIKLKYKDCKQVKDYAALLNITPLYLNEVVKEITGFTASHWIHLEIILEAKRLLNYTDLDVTEIAYELGYEDHAYFSRFFKKNTGSTPSFFRNVKP